MKLICFLYFQGTSARKLRYKDFFDPPPGGVKAARNKLLADGADGDESGSDLMEKETEAEQMDEGHESSSEEDDPPVTKNLLGDDDDDSVGNAGKKSTFELRQERVGYFLCLDKSKIALYFQGDCTAALTFNSLQKYLKVNVCFG